MFSKIFISGKQGQNRTQLLCLFVFFIDAARSFTAKRLILASFLLIMIQGQAFAITWEQQAERLLQVSATLLDSPPIGSPHRASFGLGIVLDTSFLPKPNTTVGIKSEKVPSAPLHVVPTLQLEKLIPIGKRGFIVAGGYGGYLPAGSEKLIGLKAKATQSSFGGNIGAMYVASKSLRTFIDFGYHYTSAQVEGAITAPDAKDKFVTRSAILFARPGFFLPKLSIWGSLLIGKKTTTAQLEIPDDDTKIFTTDTLKDAPLPAFFQFTLGYAHKSTGINSALSYIVVPYRAYMPKLQLSWVYDLQGKEKSNKSNKKSGSKEKSEKKRGSKRKKKPLF